MSSTRPLRIWRLLDGKPGHEKQSLGLARALARETEVALTDIAISHRARLARQWWRQRRDTPPHWVIGAGHRTHLLLVWARYCFGCRCAVLMKPSLPLRCFDAVIAPAHDGLPPGERVLTTTGVLNPMAPGDKTPGTGLILVGGPSAHFGWDDGALAEQIDSVVRADPGRQWLLSDSRRTPPDFIQRFQNRPELQAISWRDTGPGWLEQQLARCEQAWVSADSVSMVYEALTAGAAVGVLSLPDARPGSRVVKGLQQLQAQHWVTAFSHWQSRGQLAPAPGRLDEAGRAARWLLEADHAVRGR